MTRIGIISDTHGYLDGKVFEHFKDVHEIWHGGDFGGLEIAEELRAFKPLRGVWGNIDDNKTRVTFPEVARFSVEGVKVRTAPLAVSCVMLDWLTFAMTKAPKLMLAPESSLSNTEDGVAGSVQEA